ncbi:MAG: peptidoglycan DD-metalloendopeptidase family protein [Pseudomonadales bacterium]
MRIRFSHLALLLVLATSSIAGLAQVDEEATLAEVKKELEALNAQLQQYQSEHSELEREMRDQEIELSRLHREIYNTDRAIDVGAAQLSRLTRQRQELQQLSNIQEEAIRSDLVAMYKSGQQEPVKVLLNMEDPAQLSRMLIYYRYLLGARSARIDAYAQTISQLEKNQQEINQQNARLDNLRSELRQQETSLNASLARRARLMERLQSRILSAEQQIAERAENAKRLEQLIQEAVERIARLAPPETYRPFAELRGRFHWPVNGQISHRFGSARAGDLHWQGVVLNADSGTEIHSIHHGRVVFADYMRGYGLLVIVDHEDGYMTLYGHNQSLFVEPGDWVSPGDQLALVGNTGGLAEPGLYFEIRQNGKPVDPASWCTRGS